MGCCPSLPDMVASRLSPATFTSSSSSLTQAELVQLETLLSGIPDHCREAIINLPARQLLNLYQYHIMALCHGLQKEWQLAISYEHRVIKGLQALLPADKDHYIFSSFYTILSASFLALGALQAAIEGLHIALAILLKHTPMDYKTISTHYYHLADAYNALHNSKATARYLTKAFDTVRLRKDLDDEYIPILGTELQSAKTPKDKNELSKSTSSRLKRECNDNYRNIPSRKTANIITCNTEHSILRLGKSEFDRLLSKQTEV